MSILLSLGPKGQTKELDCAALKYVIMSFCGLYIIHTIEIFRAITWQLSFLPIIGYISNPAVYQKKNSLSEKNKFIHITGNSGKCKIC